MMIRYYGKAAKPSNLLASRVQVDILLRKELLLFLEEREKERERVESNECTGEKNLLLKTYYYVGVGKSHSRKVSR